MLLNKLTPSIDSSCWRSLSIELASSEITLDSIGVRSRVADIWAPYFLALLNYDHTLKIL
jgi:hypothetical protein